MHLHGADQPAARDLAALALAEPDAGAALWADAGELLASASFFMREDLPQALEHITRAAELAVGVGEPHLVGNAVSMKAVIEATLGRNEWKATLQSLAHVGDAPRGEPVVTAPGFHAAMIALWTDRAAEAATVLRGYRENATAHGDEGSLPLILAELAVAEFLVGRWPEAAAVAEQSLEIAVQAAQRPPQAFALAARALVFASRGLEARARADAGKVLALAGDRGMVGGQDPRGLGARDPRALARSARRGRECARRRSVAGCCPPASGSRARIPFAADEIEALIALGSRPTRPRPGWRGWTRTRTPSRCRGGARRRRCAAAGCSRRARRRRRSHSNATSAPSHEQERVGAPLEPRRTLLALGTVQRRLKHGRSRARRWSARGTSSTHWARRSGADAHGPSSRASAAGRERLSGLTPTEGRVAALVAEGRSNKEIAATLFVTPKTVETQLSRIYGKLGVHSRIALMRSLGKL